MSDIRLPKKIWKYIGSRPIGRPREDDEGGTSTCINYTVYRIVAVTIVLAVVNSIDGYVQLVHRFVFPLYERSRNDGQTGY